jgi:hypothetical protein
LHMVSLIFTTARNRCFTVLLPARLYMVYNKF